MKILHLIHTLLFYAALFLTGVLLLILMTITAWLPYNLNNLYFQVTRFFARILLLIAGVRVEVRGKEYLSSADGSILAVNHPGFIDFLVYYVVVPFRFRYVIAYTFFQAPLIRFLVRKMGYIPLGERPEKRRRISIIGSGAEIIGAIKKGDILLVFPEGQRKKEPGEVMARFRTWTARVVQLTGVKIIPMAIRGTETILPKMRFILY